MSENDNVTISVVVPVYGCRNALQHLISRLESVLIGLVPTYEIVLVEDGCPDYSWGEIESLVKKNSFVTGIKLSRNFGQHEAITAGLNYAMGDWVVVMDCDLQDRPEEISRLYSKAIEGYDVVFARRVNRQDSFIKKMSSHLFYIVLGYLTDTHLDATIANFGIYSRKVIRAILSMNESLRYFPVMVRWVGFPSTDMEVEHSESNDGKSSYSWNTLFRLAVNVIVSFSDKPLRIIVKTGFWISLFSAFYAIILIMGRLGGGISVQGWTSVMVSLWFIGGLLMMMLGVVGVYVGKAFDETKQRPNFIIEKLTFFDK